MKSTKNFKKLGHIEEPTLKPKVKTAIDFARKNLILSVTGQAVLEGIATTLADTEDIINGLKVREISDEDAQKILNLKRAWEFVLNEYTI